MDKPPRFSITDIVGVAFIFIGFLILLIIINFLYLEAIGPIKNMLETMFIIFLNFFRIAAIFTGLAVLFLLLRRLVWETTTPKWQKDKAGK